MEKSAGDLTKKVVNRFYLTRGVPFKFFFFYHNIVGKHGLGLMNVFIFGFLYDFFDQLKVVLMLNMSLFRFIKYCV
jgi:hypothetical protein